MRKKKELAPVPDCVVDEYDRLIPGLPIVGQWRSDDPDLDREILDITRRHRAEMIAEYERKRAAGMDPSAEREDTGGSPCRRCRACRCHCCCCGPGEVRTA